MYSEFYLRMCHPIDFPTKQKEIQDLMQRFFNTPDGKKVFAYLNYLVFHTRSHMDADEKKLRWQLGRESVLADILTFLDNPYIEQYKQRNYKK